MAPARTQVRSRTRRRSGRRGLEQREPSTLPYTGRNGGVLAAGIAVILIGYLCLSRPPVDGFLSLTLAPILLVLGYCVLIPIALLMGESPPKDPPFTETAENSTGG